MPDRALRVFLAATGLAAMGVGLVIGLRDVPVDQWWPVARWLAGGVLLHDAVIAPLSLLVGVLVLRRVPPRFRTALRAGLLTLGAAAVLVLCVAAAQRIGRNPTLVVTSPGWVVAGAVIAVLLVALATGAVDVRGRRLAGGRPTGSSDAGGPGARRSDARRSDARRSGALGADGEQHSPARPPLLDDAEVQRRRHRGQGT